MSTQGDLNKRNKIITFARWDGGPIEVAKAFLSGWYYITHPDSIFACNHWYSKSTIRLLKKAAIKNIWVTWSTGFSLNAEAKQRQLVTDYIAMCHENGISVTAYMSMVNLFVTEMFTSVSKSSRWLQIDRHGKPIPYSASYYLGNQVTRYLCCLNNEEWRQYLLKRVELALEADLDGVVYDNQSTSCHCPKCINDFAEYCEAKIGVKLEIPDSNQEKLIDDQPEDRQRVELYHSYKNEVYSRIYRMIADLAFQRKPNFLIYGNFNVGYGTFAFKVNNIISTEDGYEPGFFEDRLITNIGLLRSLQAASNGFRPVVIEYGCGRGGGRYTDLVPAGRRGQERYIPMTQQKHQLALAETASHGAALEITPEGWFLNGLYFEEPSAMENWNAISRYNDFFTIHEDLYVNAQSDTTIAVLVNDGVVQDKKGKWGLRIPWLNQLAAQRLVFDVIYDATVHEKKFSKYDVLIIPNTRYFSNRLAELIRGFLHNGIIIATGEAGKYDDKYTRREVGVLDILNGVKWFPDENIEDIASEARRTAKKLRVQVIASSSVLYNITKIPGDRYVVHLLNYGDEAAEEIKLSYQGIASEILEFSPDYDEDVVHQNYNGSLIVRSVKVYSVVSLNFRR